MNLAQLRAELEARGVDMGLIRLREVEPEAYDVNVVRPLPDGRWETFYTEGRGPQARRVFPSEAEACGFFLGWVCRRNP